MENSELSLFKIRQEVTFSCGHVETQYIDEECDEYGVWPRLDKCVMSDDDCGKGGLLVTCLQKQSLNKYQSRVLAECEKSAEDALLAHTEAFKRYAEWEIKTLQLRLFGDEESCVSPERAIALKRAMALEPPGNMTDWSLRGLYDAFDYCGTAIVNLEIGKRSKGKVHEFALQCAAPIASWLERTHSQHTAAVDNFVEDPIHCCQSTNDQTVEEKEHYESMDIDDYSSTDGADSESVGLRGQPSDVTIDVLRSLASLRI